MGNLEPLFSSSSSKWETPIELFKELDKEFGFVLDAAASVDNHLCDTYYTEQDDGLLQEWRSWTYCNPPYGREVSKWVQKSYEEMRKGNYSVMLLPARTDTRYFHSYIWDASVQRPREGVKVRFLKGRLKFSNAKNSAPFPSMIVVFGGGG